MFCLNLDFASQSKDYTTSLKKLLVIESVSTQEMFQPSIPSFFKSKQFAVEAGNPTVFEAVWSTSQNLNTVDSANLETRVFSGLVVAVMLLVMEKVLDHRCARGALTQTVIKQKCHEGIL